MNIRQIGDSILQTRPKPVTEFDGDSVKNMLAIMREQLYATGGMGIAANQCADIAEPLQIAIIGTADLNARKRVQQRYPNQKIPAEMVLINPKIERYFGDIFYLECGEGCLSLKGAMRAMVPRHTDVDITFQDESGQLQQRHLHGMQAHAAQHECDHLFGLTYFNHVLDDMSREQKAHILSLIEQFEATSFEAAEVKFSDTPTLIFGRDAVNQVSMVDEDFITQLQRLEIETIMGMKQALSESL